MSNPQEFSCPKCGADILLKWASDDGIQCKKCYYWATKEELNSYSLMQTVEMEKNPEASEILDLVCPKCGKASAKVADGGIMCSVCYNWINVDETQKVTEPLTAQTDLLDGLNDDITIGYSNSIYKELAEDVPFIIGEKIKDTGPVRKIKLHVKLSENDINDEPAPQKEESSKADFTRRTEITARPAKIEEDLETNHTSRLRPEPKSPLSGDRKKLAENVFQAKQFSIDKIIGAKGQGNTVGTEKLGSRQPGQKAFQGPGQVAARPGTRMPGPGKPLSAAFGSGDNIKTEKIARRHGVPQPVAGTERLRPTPSSSGEREDSSDDLQPSASASINTERLSLKPGMPEQDDAGLFDTYIDIPQVPEISDDDENSDSLSSRLNLFSKPPLRKRNSKDA